MRKSKNLGFHIWVWIGIIGLLIMSIGLAVTTVIVIIQLIEFLQYYKGAL